MNKYECCFCGKTIDTKVISLVAIFNWEKEEEEEKSQQWFCHLECLKKTLHKPGYLVYKE